MKKIGRRWPCLMAAACLLAVFLGGCSLIKVEEEGAEPVEYTIVREEDIPPEVRTHIKEKQKKEFQMTYRSGEDLYLIRGYGQQSSGGYSIQVESLMASESGIFLRTSLVGPAQGEQQSREPSYPCIVIKIAYREQPVQFE